MSRQATPYLNDLQLEVLRWIADGAPAGSYTDFRPRIVARALEKRGLVNVSGRGETWSAGLEPDGSYYLEHGQYPAQEPPDASRTRPMDAPQVPMSKESKQQGKPAKPTRIGPTDAMMTALVEGGGRIEIEPGDHRRYQQLALSAKRFKKIPDGKQVLVHSDWRSKTAWVTLERLPERMTAVLPPIPVPAKLRAPSDVVLKLQDREDIDIRAAEKKRALRLVQALADECAKRGYSIKTTTAPHKDRWDRYERGDHNQGQILITIEPDGYQLSIFQLTNKVAHIPSKWELAHGGRGYAIPQFDYPKTPDLGIRIEGKDYHFWASAWTDAIDKPLEALLPQIFQELELRHERSQTRRAEEEVRKLERQSQWEQARARAVEQLTRAHRAETLRREAANWETASRITSYANAMELVLTETGRTAAGDDATEWIAWARQYAEDLNPLHQSPQLPDPPEPTATALEPYMKPWNPYGPHR